jgi:hypothetical protein
MTEEGDRLASDPGAQALGRRLAALDLAAQSRVKDSLRARLLAKPQRPAAAEKRPHFLRLPAGLAGAAAAAAVLLLLLHPKAPLPVVAPDLAPRAAAPEAAGPDARPWPPAAWPRLPGNFPAPQTRPSRPEGIFRSRGPARDLFATVRGRRVATPSGQATVWESEAAVLTLEERRIRIEDVFVRPDL